MRHLRVAIYHNLHSGGAKRVTEEHLRRLLPDCAVALFSLSNADQHFAAHGRSVSAPTSLLDYRPLPMARSPFGRINPLLGMLNILILNRLARVTAQMIDSQAFDVVLVHPCQVTQAPLLLRWLRTPSLYYCHELPRSLYEAPITRPYLKRHTRRQILDRFDPLPRVIRTLLRRLDHTNALRATQIITNSHFTSQNILQAYGRAAAICAPGVDAHDFQPTKIAREAFVLSVGALTPAKGFDFVIDALGTLPTGGRPRLVIISNYQEPAELAYLTTLADQRGVALECHTGVSEHELQRWYARAGCVAYAPVREPFGLVALEAMAAGAALVGLAEGGIAETVVDQVSGILAPRDQLAFGQAIRQLIEHPEYAQQLGRSARQYVLERWTWEQHISQLRTLLDQTSKHALQAPQAAYS